MGATDWADFADPGWPPQDAVCSDDEWSGTKSDRPDTGDHSAYARDLNHHSSTVQAGIKDWMGWLRHDVGFVGWRYDMVKGYAGWAVEAYNRASAPLFSVGEYLDGDPQKVVQWIDGTHP